MYNFSSDENHNFFARKEYISQSPFFSRLFGIPETSASV